jgi:hypothetical protein
MPDPNITVIGVYKVEPSPQAFKDALSVQGDEDAVRQELSSVVLVELRIQSADHRFELSNFKQPHTEYVPYDETFLDIATGKPLELKRSELGFGIFDDVKTGRTMKYIQATETTVLATIEDARRYRLPGTSNFTVAFFLHFFDHRQPLETPYGPLTLPPSIPLPERLMWKEYFYWD